MPDSEGSKTLKPNIKYREIGTEYQKLNDATKNGEDNYRYPYNDVPIQVNALGSHEYIGLVNKFNDQKNKPYSIFEYNTDGEKTELDPNDIYKDQLTSVRNMYAMKAYTKLIAGIVDQYDELYNGYCGNVSRAGKGTEITITDDKILENIPCIRAVYEKDIPLTDARTALESMNLFVFIRGLPIPMKKFMITDVACLFLYPEYLFSFYEAINSFDYIYISNYKSDIKFYKGNNTYNKDEQNPGYANEKLFTDKYSNLNLIYPNKD